MTIRRIDYCIETEINDAWDKIKITEENMNKQEGKALQEKIHRLEKEILRVDYINNALYMVLQDIADEVHKSLNRIIQHLKNSKKFTELDHKQNVDNSVTERDV